MLDSETLSTRSPSPVLSKTKTTEIPRFVQKRSKYYCNRIGPRDRFPGRERVPLAVGVNEKLYNAFESNAR